MPLETHLAIPHVIRINGLLALRIVAATTTGVKCEIEPGPGLNVIRDDDRCSARETALVVSREGKG